MNTLLTVGYAVFFAFSASENIYREMSVQTPGLVSEQRYDMRPILGPITSGGEARALDCPSDCEIVRVLSRIPRYKLIAGRLEKDDAQLIQIVKEKCADYVDAPRDYPLIGKAQLHHAKYRCSIEFYDGKAADSKLSQTIVVYIDHNHFHVLQAGDGKTGE